MFSLMWSEHCSYKHSKQLLRTLPTEGPRVVMGPGENAGAVDVGDGIVVRVQGRVATTTPARSSRSRARPPASAGSCATSSRSARGRSRSSTRCASASSTSERSRYLLERAVAGHRPLRQLDRRAPPSAARSTSRRPTSRTAWSTRCASASLETERLIRCGRGRASATRWCCSARAPAATASAAPPCSPRAELDEDDAAKRPTVQIGDPFEEKKLLECSLELLEHGPARLAAGPRRRRPDVARRRRWPPRARSASTSTSARCRCARPTWSPSRSWSPSPRSGCSAWSSPSSVDEVLAVCARWEVDGDGDRRGHRRASACACSTAARWWATCPSPRWSTTCPLYDLEPAAPAGAALPGAEPRRSPTALDARATLLGAARLGQHRLAGAGPSSSTTALVGSRTVRRPEEADAAVLLLDSARPIGRARPAHRRLDRRQRPPRRLRPVPRRRRGGRSSARRNLACVGAEPLGLTNCLNFGNPEKPHIAWQLSRAVAGHGRRLPRARRAGRRRQRLALQRGRRRPDLPDAGRRHGRRAARRAARGPARLRRRRRRGRAGRGRSGAVARPGPSWRSCAASRCRTALPHVDLGELARARTPRSARPSARARCASAHDVAEGGLAVALAECCIAGGRGADVDARAARERDGEHVAVRRGPRRVRGLRRPPRRCARSAPRRPSSATVGGERAARCARRRARRASSGRSALRHAARGWPACSVDAAAPLLACDGSSGALRLGRPRDHPRHRSSDPATDRATSAASSASTRPGTTSRACAYFALYALQHRGQESAGIAACAGRAHHDRARPGPRQPGLRRAEAARARRATWPSATSATRPPAPTRWENAQPVWRADDARARARPQRQPRSTPSSCTPSCARPGVDLPLDLGLGDHRRAARRRIRPSELEDAIADVMPRLHGAYSTVVMVERPHRAPSATPPACARSRSGMLGDRYCVASESCALRHHRRQVHARRRAGRAGHARRRAASRPARSSRAPARAFCVFEHIYFARPDSRLEGRVVQASRSQDGRDPRARGAGRGRPRDRGARLRQRRRRAATPARPGIPQDDGFVKNRYVARTFIQPGQELRKHGLRLKFNPLPEVVAGKRLVVVDDSIVRGNTTRQIVADAARRRRRSRCTCGSRRRRSATPATTASTCRRARR